MAEPDAAPNEMRSPAPAQRKRTALLLLSDAEFRDRIAERAAEDGLDVIATGEVAEAVERCSADVGAILLDAALASDAGPLMAKALETSTPVIVAGTARQGEEALHLIESGAWGYFPLPQAAKVVADQLATVLIREEERGVDSRVQRAKNELQAVFDTFPSALLVLWPDMRIRRANRAALALSRGVELIDVVDEDLKFAMQGLLEKDFRQAYGCATEKSKPLADAVRDGGEGEFEMELTTGPAGSARARPCRVKVFPKGESAEEDDKLGDGRLLLVEDVTQRRRQEAEHARAQQLEAVALLAATLSHEINQPLGSILGRAQLGLLVLDEEPPDLAEVRRDLKEVVSGVERVKRILEKIHRVADIVTKPYIGDSEILDLEKSAKR